MIGKSLAVGIVIGGSIAASFSRSIKTADEKTLALGATIRKASDQKASIVRFRALGKALGKTSRDMKAAQSSTASLAQAIAKSEAKIKALQAEGKKTGQALSSGMQTATEATLTWSQFTSQRMSTYMKELGGHAPAIKKIAAEWKVYKVEHGKAMKGASKTATTELSKEQDALKKLQAEFRSSVATSGKLKRAHQRQKEAIGKLRGELRGAGIDVRRLGSAEKTLGRSIEKTNRAMDRQRRKQQAGRRLGALRNRALGAVGSVYGVARLVGRNAEFEHALTMLSNTGNLSREKIAKIRTKLRSESVKTNQTKAELLGGLDFLVGKGLKTKASVAAIHDIGIAATGSGASIIDLSKASFAMMDNMKISSLEVAKGLDIIASSGKQGGFELVDMARFLPSITAQVQVLGLKGKQGIASIGAALQIAMKGAGKAEEGANNLQNFLSKITSKETVNNLQKMGVSVRDVFDNAKANGENPLIAIIRSIKEVTGGDSFALNQIFGDMQVKNFLNPMLANIDEFNKIYSKSLKAQGVNQRDFTKNMKDTSEKMKHLKIGVENVGDAFARSLRPAIDPVLDGLGSVAQWASDVIVRYPVVGQIIGGIAIGFAGLTTAIGLATAAQWAWNTSVVASSVAMLRNASGAIWAGGAYVAGAAKIGILTAAQWLWNVAMDANPIGLVIAGVAALAGGAVLLYKNWDSVTKWFGKKLDWLTNKFSFVGDAWHAIFGGDKKATVTQHVKQTFDTIKKPVFSKAAPAALAATMAMATPAAASPAQTVHQDNRASYVLHVNVDGGDPAQVKDAVHQALAEKEREHAARTRGALFDIQGG